MYGVTQIKMSRFLDHNIIRHQNPELFIDPRSDVHVHPVIREVNSSGPLLILSLKMKTSFTCT